MTTSVNDVTTTGTTTGTSSDSYGGLTSTEDANQAFGDGNIPAAESIPPGDLDAIILSVFTQRGQALDTQTYNQVQQLQQYNTEMTNANNAEAAAQAAGSGKAGSATFQYTNPSTGQVSSMSVSTYMSNQGKPVSGGEDNSDIETTLNDIGTEAQGMSQQWSTDVSATMQKDNEAWEAGSDLVNKVGQTLNTLISNFK